MGTIHEGGRDVVYLNAYSSRNISALIHQQQIKWENRPDENVDPIEIILDIAQKIEENARFLEGVSKEARPAVDSLVEIVGYLRAWVN